MNFISSLLILNAFIVIIFNSMVNCQYAGLSLFLARLERVELQARKVVTIGTQVLLNFSFNFKNIG
jgi:hypothetical protein